MKNFKLGLAAVILLFVSSQSQAQHAYKGEGDYKLFAGYSYVGGASGINLQFDGALNHWLSLGMQWDYLFNAKANFEDDDVFKDFNRLSIIFNSFNAGLYLRGHLGPAIGMEETIDPYFGAEASFQSIAVHAGLKVQIQKRVGAYLSYNQGITRGLFGRSLLKVPNFYANSGMISAGLIFDFKF